MKPLRLLDGTLAFVDDVDLEGLNQFRWRIMRTPRPGKFYVVRTVKVDGRWTTELLHRRLVGMPGLDVDHRDGNGLNNQRSNLRVCTRSQNQCNRGAVRANRFGLKGVRKRANHRRYEAKINSGGRYIHLGSFDTVIEAARAYNDAAKLMFGEYASLNEIVGV